VEDSVNRVRNGENPDLTTRQMHTREVFVVAEEGADKEKIDEEIRTMPNYFADYDTTVTFISEEEMKKNHAALPHGGFVIRSGVTGFDREHKQIIEYNLKLDSNPEFTGSILVAYARAAFRLFSEGQTGCKTIFDIAPAYLSPLSGEELRAHLL
jgi:diaminopimelate dehydrogenase